MKETKKKFLLSQNQATTCFPKQQKISPVACRADFRNNDLILADNVPDKSPDTIFFVYLVQFFNVF